MATHKIKTATAAYTGGGIYIYYGQLKSGLFFRACDEMEVIYICNADTESEEADYAEFYNAHTVEEINGDGFKTFWNQMLLHIISGGANHGEWANYSKSELESRIIK
jgi:hypothetical protein